MASIHKECLIEASADEVWDAVRDFDASTRVSLPASSPMQKRMVTRAS